jgi:hypothetical protein
VASVAAATGALGGEQAGRRKDVLPVDGDGGVLGHLPAAGVVGEQRGERGAGGSGLGMAQEAGARIAGVLRRIVDGLCIGAARAGGSAEVHSVE